MRLRDVANQAQPESAARHALRSRRGAAIEGLEQVLGLATRHSGTPVLHHELQLARAAGHPGHARVHRDRLSRPVLQRIVDEVPERAAQRHAIGDDRSEPRRHVDLDGLPRAHLRQHLAHQVRRVHFLEPHAPSPGQHARQLERLLDQRGEPLALAVHHHPVTPHLLGDR